MLTGNLEIHEIFEKNLAKFLGKEDALVFSSGYLACVSCIQGLATKKDLIVMDKLCHNSLTTGATLSRAKVVKFKHNDFKHAEQVIKESYNKKGKIYIVIESVYSMDGDIGDLPTARKLADKYGATLIMDEAHGMGTIGKTGRGAEEHFNYVARADLICGSLTKSFGSVGGYICCSAKWRLHYTFTANGAIFSAPISAFNCGAAIKSLEILENHPERVQKLQENAQYMKEKFETNNFNLGGAITCVMPVIFRDPIQMMDMHVHMLRKGLFAAAVVAPACALDAPRFRICTTYRQTKEEIDYLVDTMIEARSLCKESDRVKELLAAQ